MLDRLERLLNLRHGDFGRGSLLFSYYFLTIAGYVVGNSTRTALFLERFDRNELPKAEVAIAVCAGIFIAAYIRLARRVALGRLLAGSLTVFAVIGVLFWWAFGAFDADWLYPALYIWLAISGLLAVAQVWTLANFVLTTREAKRVFGLIGSGGILGGIFGGLVVRSLAEPVGTENLLMVLVSLLAICAVLVLFISRQRDQDAGGPKTGLDLSPESPGNLRASLRLVFESPHLRLIAALICIGAVVTKAVGWQFAAMASEYWTDTDQLTAFFGTFDMGAGIFSFAAQFFITSRVLQRFGLGIALLLLPATLALGSVGLLIWGNLVAVTLLRGSDKILRYSVDTAALQLLYLPVASGIKVQVKSFIDTVILRLGDGFAGVVLLIFATWLGFTPQAIAWVILVFLVGWIFVANRARGAYLTTLGDRLQQHRVDQEEASAPVLDRSTTAVLASKLSSSEPDEILYGLSLFEAGYHQTAHPAMHGLIRHESREVRAKVLSVLNAAGDASLAIDDVQVLLSDSDLKTRTEALDYLTRHKHVDPLDLVDDLDEFPEHLLRSAIVAFLSRPGPTQNLEVARMMLDAMLDGDGPDRRALRLEAARVSAADPKAFSDQLKLLLDDPDTEVVKHALEGAGSVRRLEFAPPILKCMANPVLKDSATLALAGFGSRIVGTLDDHLKDDEVPMAVRREIPGILLAIGTKEAQRVLLENLLQGDSELRFRMIGSLNKFQKDHPDIGMDREPVETVMVAELLGHHRSYQAFEALARGLEADDPALAAFRESLDKEVERVFRLLGLLYPEHDIHAVHVGLGSGDARLHDNALEFLESVLPLQLRELLVPLIDSGITLRERTTRATKLIGQEVTTSEDAVRMLISSGDPWLKSCAAYAIGALGLTSLKSELDSMQSETDPLLAETVRQARVQLAALAKEGSL